MGDDDIYGNMNGMEMSGSAMISADDFGVDCFDSDEEVDEPVRVQPPPRSKQPTMKQKKELEQMVRGPTAPPRGPPSHADDEDGTDEDEETYEPVKRNRTPTAQRPVTQHLPPEVEQDTYEVPVPQAQRARHKTVTTRPKEVAPAAPPRLSMSMKNGNVAKPSWLQPALGREEAEHVVGNMVSGDFIIRSSTRSGYTLVVNDNGVVLNLPVSKKDGMHTFGGQSYRSLQVLVDDLGPHGENHMRSNKTGGRLILNIPTSSAPASPDPPPSRVLSPEPSGSKSPDLPPLNDELKRKQSLRANSHKDDVVDLACWYVGSMSQNDARKAVSNAQVGTFVIRDSKDKQVMVIRDSGKITSFQFKIKDGSCHFANRTFASIDAVVENLRFNTVRGHKNQAIRPGSPAAGGWIHLSAARRIAKEKRMRGDISDHAWWTCTTAKECTSVLAKATAGQFLVRPSSDGSQIYVHVKDGNTTTGTFVQTYQFAKDANKQYIYGGTRHPNIASVIELMRKPTGQMPVPLSTPARGGNVHPSVFIALANQDAPSADVRALSISANQGQPRGVYHQPQRFESDNASARGVSTRRVFRLSDSGDGNSRASTDAERSSARTTPKKTTTAAAFQFWGSNSGAPQDDYDSDEIDI
eukprot:m.174290 g.174290  ORF g.174290 m.174290 type:complete len:638 (-) comp31763_c3_seq1:86-1999(-)